jgi:hypothetical protein
MGLVGLPEDAGIMLPRDDSRTVSRISVVASFAQLCVWPEIWGWF